MYSVIKKENYSMLVFQETKLAQGKAFNWQNMNNVYDIWEVRCTNARLGLLIALKKALAGVCHTEFVMLNKRLCALKCNLKGFRFEVINVHAPILLGNRKLFFKSLAELITECDRVIVTGDWNVNNASKEKDFVSFVNQFGLIDVAKHFNMGNICTRRDKKSCNRLDRTVVSNDLISYLKFGIKSMILTDHSLMLLVLKGVKKKVFKKMIPTFLDLNNKDVCKVWNEENMVLISDFNELDILAKWTAVKSNIYDKAVYKEKNRKRIIDKNIVILNGKLDTLIREGKNDLLSFDLYKCNIEKLYAAKFKFLSVKARGLWRHNRGKNKDGLIKWLKKRRNNSYITKIQSKNVIINDPQEIVDSYHEKLCELSSYQLNSNLQRAKCEEFRGKANFKFFVSKNLKTVPQDRLESLDLPFTGLEIEAAIKGLKNKLASPGPDGINITPYRAMNLNLYNTMAELMNWMGEKKVGSDTFAQINQVTIIPIGKKIEGNVPLSIHDIRPIGLVNTDMKIMARVILNRISPVLNIILPQECCAMKNRGILGGLWQHYGVFKNRVNFNKDEYLIRIDFQKAYTMCNTDYLEYIIEKHMGANRTTFLCHAMCKYKSCSVKMQGIVTKSKVMLGGLIQGAPLSGDVYNLYLADLIITLKNNVRGIKVKYQQENSFITTYIDDLSIFASDMRDVENVIGILRDFQYLTGTKINFAKSYIYNLRTDSTVKHSLLRGSHGKILGVFFSSSKPARDRSVLESKIDEIKALLKKWRLSNVSMIRRVNLINKLIVPKVIYFLMVEPITEKWCSRIQSLCTKFIFKKLRFLSGVKASYPLEHGGFNLLDLRCLSKAIKAKMFRKMMLEGNKVDVEYIEVFCLNSASLIKQAANNYKEVISILPTGLELSYRNIRKGVLDNSDGFKRYRNKECNLKNITILCLSDNLEDFIVKWTLGVLPSKSWLSRRNFKGITSECESCHGAEEDLNHIFLVCKENRDFLERKLKGLET